VSRCFTDADGRPRPRHRPRSIAHRALEKFIQRCIEKNSGEAFEVFRLVLPHLDYDRPPYNLKAPQVTAPPRRRGLSGTRPTAAEAQPSPPSPPSPSRS
jgi:hypothetical protein